MNSLFELLDSSLPCKLHKENIHIDSVTFARREMIPDVYRAMITKNAGGRSEISEAMSIQHFHDTYGGSDFILEKEVIYYLEYKMVDYITLIRDQRVGVSVTRAMNHLDPELFTIEDARKLLRKKLYGLCVARNCIVEAHSFYKSVLHVFCQTRKIAEMMIEAYGEYDNTDLNINLEGTVTMLLTICSDPFIYRNEM